MNTTSTCMQHLFCYCTVFSFFRGDGAGPADAARRRPPDKCFDWDSIADPLRRTQAGQNFAYLVLSYSEQRRPKMCGHHIENLFVLGSPQLSGPWRSCGHGSYRRYAAFSPASSFTRFPGGLKPPVDTHLHACKREVNQNFVTIPGQKQWIVVTFWTQNSLRSHLTAKFLVSLNCSTDM